MLFDSLFGFSFDVPVLITLACSAILIYMLGRLTAPTTQPNETVN